MLRFIEGPQDRKARNRKSVDSPFGVMWERVDQAVSDIIDHTTFADLLRLWEEKHAKFVPNWEI